MKKHNFNAGPSILPREVIEDTAKAILDFNGSGLSLMEISHRAKDFQPVVDEAEALFKELLNIPEGYSVLFLGGGASMEFCMVPYNFLEKKAAYLNTGVWAKKAMKEAKGFGEVVEVASSAEATYTYIPKDYTIPTDADYFHITTREGRRRPHPFLAPEGPCCQSGQPPGHGVEWDARARQIHGQADGHPKYGSCRQSALPGPRQHQTGSQRPAEGDILP